MTTAAISCHGLVVSAAKLDEDERTTGQTQKQPCTAVANVQYLRALYLAQLAGLFLTTDTWITVALSQNRKAAQRCRATQ